MINSKYQLQHGMMNLNYQMDHILYQIFITILSIFLKKNMEESLVLILQQEYVNKIENRIIFKVKKRYYLQFLSC